MKRRLHFLNGIASITLLTATGLALASGGDTWTTLAHDQKRTARATGKGEMTDAPQVAWKYTLGGSLAEDQLAAADVNGDGVDELVFVSAGRVVARSATTGTTSWVSESIGASRVVGVWDLDGTPPAEVVVAGQSPQGAYILSAGTGQTLWYEPTTSMAFDLLAVPSAPGYRLLLARQLGLMTAYEFSAGVVDPATNKAWDSTTSPWSVDMTAADLDKDGKLEVIRGADRGFEALDLATGALRCDGTNAITGTNAPAYFPVINTADVDGDGRYDIVMYDYSYYYSEDAGVFVWSCNGAGATLSAVERWKQQWVTDVTPGSGNDVNAMQVRYLADGVADYDGNPGLEMVYSLWDASSSSWSTVLVNAATGAQLAVKTGEVLEAVADLDDNGLPEALLREATGIGAMPKPYFSTIRLYSLSNLAFHNKGWQMDAVRAATLSGRRSRVVTAGAGTTGAHQNTDTDPAEEVYVFAGAPGQGTDDPRPGKLLAVRGADGLVLHEYTFPATISGDVFALGAHLQNATSASEAVVMLTNGELNVIDTSFTGIGTNRPGNFGHMPIVASIDGASNVVVTQTSPGHLVALNGTKVQSQQPAEVWKVLDVIQSETRGYLNTPGLVIPNNPGPAGKLMVRAHKSGAFEEQSLVALTATGTKSWTADLGTGRTVAGFENFELLDDLDGDGVRDVFLTEIEADGSQQLVIRKGSDGTTLATRATGDLFPPAGSYLQGHAAIDLNGDGKLDIVSPLHGSWFVGIDVSQAAGTDPTKQFVQIFRRANAPANGQAMIAQLDQEPDLDLLRVNSQNAFGPYERRDLLGLVEITISSPHPTVAGTDTNTAAIISRPGSPGAEDFVWAGMSGDALGAVARVAGDTFSEVWFAYLAQGQAAYDKADPPAGRAALSPPIAADIDGDNEDEVLVGSEDGYLYALRTFGGQLLFAVDLGAPVMHVIAADIDKDPGLELVAVVADGTIVALDQAGKYVTDNGGSEPQPEAGPETGAGGGPAEAGTGGSSGAGGSSGGAGQAGATQDAGDDAAAGGGPGPTTADDGGCGCRAVSGGPSAASALLLGLGLGLARLRRRR